MRRWLTIICMIGFLASCYACASIQSLQAHADYEKGLTLFNQGKFREAIPYFEKAIQVAPEHYNAYLYLGRCYLNLQEYANALPHLRTAYRLSPENFKKEIVDIFIDAAFGAALSAAKKGNLLDAIGYLKEGLMFDPNSEKMKKELSSLYINKAYDSLLNGKFQDAISTYYEALNLSPNSLEAYLGLARAFMNTGDISKALDAIGKARSIDPNSTSVIQMLRELLGK